MIAISDIVILTVGSALVAVALVRSYGTPDTLPTSAELGGQSTVQTIQPPETEVTPGQTQAPTPVGNTANPDGNSQAGTAADSNSSGNSGVINTETPAIEITPAPVQPAAPALSTYVVKSGDSLSKIANQFGTTVSELQLLNELRGTRILVGQRLLYPTPGS